MTTTVRQILASKEIKEVFTISPEATIYQALELLAEKDIGALPVVEGDQLVGIFSERDYARNIPLKMESARETRVREIMTEDVLGTRPENTASECMSVMIQKRIRHLPVIDDGELAGIVTIGDIGKQIISDQQTMINHLEYYITRKP